MSIVAAEIKRYKSATVNDTASNGGRMSANESVSGTSGNVWPDASEAERTAGSTKYRKLFHKIANDDDLTLSTGRVFLERVTPGDDEIYLFEGTQTDVQSGIATPDLYGAGALATSVLASATSFNCSVEDGAVTIFRSGDTVRISDKATVTASGNEEYHTLTGTPTATGDVWTLAITGTLANTYSNSDTVISSVIESGDVACAISGVVETTASGTFDENSVTFDNIGTIYQSWTITFSDASNFSVAGDVVGSVGSGNISSTFSPTNADFSKPYFNIPAAVWGGTWAAAETVVFISSPAAVPVWEKRVIPAGASSLAGNSRIVVVSGESA